MKVIVTRSTFVRGEAFEAGPEPVELETTDAKTLIGMGKAVAYVAPVTSPLAPLPTGDGKTAPEDLTAIRGVGAATVALLAEQGITTFEQLRGADLDALGLSASVKKAIETWRGG